MHRVESEKPISTNYSELIKELTGQVDPEVASECFQAILYKEHPHYEGKRGRPATRVQRVWNVFRQREYKPVSLNEMAEEFSEAKHPRQSASSAVAWSDDAFHQLDLNLKIESMTVKRNRKRITFYYLHHRSPPKAPAGVAR